MALRKINLMHRIFGICDGHACGAFNRTLNRQPVVREVVPERKTKTDNEPIEGQIMMEV